jgi:hypothetical protein
MLSGKGMFIWMIRFTLNGDVKAIADRLEAAGMTHVWIKVADGAGRYNINPQGVDLVPGLIAELRMRGIACWGWQYVYGKYPDAEAAMAIRRIRELDLDGFVVNAEVEYKSAGAAGARKYMGLVRGAFPNLSIGLSSYRFPSVHPEFPFDAFLELCDFIAPQVYWVGAHNAGEQLRRCLTEYRTLIDTQRPVFPTGSAYKENVKIGGVFVSWQPSEAEVIEFMDTAKELGLPGFNFWEMRNTLMNLPLIWKAIAEWDGALSDPEEPEYVPVEEVVGMYGEVVSDWVNVRNGPSINHADIGDLVKGERVKIYDVDGSDVWCLINLDPPKWVAKRFLDKVYVRILPQED